MRGVRVAALVAAVLCGAMLLFAIGVAVVDLDALVIWLLPVWGVCTLLSIAFAITAAAKRGTANITMAAISGACSGVSVLTLSFTASATGSTQTQGLSCA